MAWFVIAGGGENAIVRLVSISNRAASLLRRAGSRIENAIVPNACVFCGSRRQTDQVPICNDCYTDLPWIGQRCGRCSRPVATTLPYGVSCAACQLDPPLFTAVITPLLYTFPVDAAIKSMKFKRRLHYVPAFTEILVASLSEVPDDVDALLPVPLHWHRQMRRGFNQAAELSKPIAQKLGVPTLRCVLRVRPTPYQSGLDARARQRNLRSAFAARGDITASHVLIIDDVITTGETCRQLVRVLIGAGVEKVSVLAIARAAG